MSRERWLYVRASWKWTVAVFRQNRDIILNFFHGLRLKQRKFERTIGHLNWTRCWENWNATRDYFYKGLGPTKSILHTYDCKSEVSEHLYIDQTLQTRFGKTAACQLLSSRAPSAAACFYVRSLQFKWNPFKHFRSLSLSSCNQKISKIIWDPAIRFKIRPH